MTIMMMMTVAVMVWLLSREVAWREDQCGSKDQERAGYREQRVVG